MSDMRLLRAAATGLAVLLVSHPAGAHGYKRKSLEVVHPWAAPTAASSGGEGAVGMTLRTSGKKGDRLLAAATPLADKVEFCQLPAEAGGAILKPDKIEIKPGTALQLKPAALHLRLVGMKKRLAPYDSFPMTLTFERAGKLEIEVTVEDTDSVKPHVH